MDDKIWLTGKKDRKPEERMSFDGFTFPVLPSLKYQADGPDKRNPDRLFIEDRGGRFLLYFEAGQKNAEEAHSSLTDYGKIELRRDAKKLSLYYPLQKKKPEICVGYFCIRFPEENCPEICCGDLSIRLPKPYCKGLQEYEDLRILLDGLAIGGKENGNRQEDRRGLLTD